MGRKIGYLRVSTQEQALARQLDALTPLCDEHHVEQLSAVARRRPVFDQVLADLEAGDTLVVLDLDRAFRSVVDAIKTVEDLKARNIALKIVNLDLDTNTPAGMLVYTVLGACAEFERRLLSQRTKEGLAAARRRGAKIGRPPKLTRRVLEKARTRLVTEKVTIKRVAADLDVAPWSLSRALKKEDVQ